MKVLYLPLNTPDFKQTGMLDAFNSFGVDLKEFDYNMMFINKIPKEKISNNFINIVEEFKPDLIHCQLQFSDIINLDCFNKIKKINKNIIISNWSGDIRNIVPSQYIKTSQYIDYNLISSSGQLDLYSSKCNKKIYYWQIGYDPKIYFPKHKNTFKSKSIFIGNNWNTSNFPGQKERVSALKNISNKFKNSFHIYGSGWSNEGLTSLGSLKLIDLNDYYNNSLSCISINNFNNISHYFSDRLLLTIASGRPTIALNFPGIKDYFIDNEEILIAKNPKEFADKISWILNNPEKAEAIGCNGHKKVLHEHTYKSRVLELFKLMGFI